LYVTFVTKNAADTFYICYHTTFSTTMCEQNVFLAYPKRKQQPVKQSNIVGKLCSG